MSFREDIKLGKCRADKLFLGTNKGTEVTTTAAELNQLDGNIFSDMTPGIGISAGTGTICEHNVTKIGGIYKTEILIDLTGLHGGGANDDILGVDVGAANCHIGQITAAVNGTIIAGRIDVFEDMAGGDPDIDLYSATVATGAQDTLVTALDETQLCDSGDLAAGTPVYLTALPAANEYLYLANGTFTDAAYSAGIILITLWGV